MPDSKRVLRKGQIEPQASPIARRPRSPGRAYGVPKDKKGLLPWNYVVERMTQAQHYWVCTVSAQGRPHATPVDGIWLDDRLYFGGYSETRRHRNLAENPSVCIHLESASDVVILQGEAHDFRAPDRDTALRLSQASAQKYGYGLKPEDYETGSGTFEFRPQVVYAWEPLLKDVTRWDIVGEGSNDSEK
jgi:nitroimidazol reductase NimA-like FMN-containing flavoprotein (pyridoxamine 5'-phosphate oxidase superfamily)